MPANADRARFAIAAVAATTAIGLAFATTPATAHAAPTDYCFTEEINVYGHKIVRAADYRS